MQFQYCELERRRNEYRLLMPDRIRSAAIPYVRMDEVLGIEAESKSLVRRIGREWFCTVARRALGLEPMAKIVAAAALNGASRVLHIGSASGLTDNIGDGILGPHVWVSTAGMRTGHFGKAFAVAPKFNICICDLDFGELLEFPSLLAEIRPFMAIGGTIVAYHFNKDSAVLPADSELAAEPSPKQIIHIYRTGSQTIARLLNTLRWCKRFYDSREFDKLFFFVIRMAVSEVRSLAGSFVRYLTALKFFEGHKQLAAHILRKNIVIEIVLM